MIKPVTLSFTFTSALLARILIIGLNLRVKDRTTEFSHPNDPTYKATYRHSGIQSGRRLSSADR